MPDITPAAWELSIMTTFETYWRGVFPDVTIASPNRSFDREKVVGDTFIEWFNLGAPGGQTRYSHSVANNHFSREGTWTFTANVRVKAKVALALDLLNAIGLFYETVVIPIGGGYFKEVGTPVPLGDDGAWHQVSLSSQWLYFTDRTSVLP